MRSLHAKQWNGFSSDGSMMIGLEVCRAYTVKSYRFYTLVRRLVLCNLSSFSHAGPW